jgi:hypothetical protein
MITPCFSHRFWRQSLRLLSIALILLTASLAPRPSHAADQSPRAFLQAIYARYTGNDSAPGIPLNTDPDIIKQYFSPEMAQIMITAYQNNTSDDVEGWDVDFFVDNPDWVIPSVKITVDDKPSGDRTKAKVSFVNQGSLTTIVYDLVHVDGNWRIDNIQWPDGTLRKVFKK